MAIEYRCPGCNRLLRVGDDTAGQIAQCPECGAQAFVRPPGPTMAGTVPPRQPQDDGPFFGGPQYRFDWHFAPAAEIKALVSLGLGSLGLFLCLLGFCCGCIVYLTIPMAIAGILLGFQGLRSYSRAAAVAGIFFSSMVLVMSLLVLSLHHAFVGGHHGMIWGR
jgi:DNA-directed RNA polymerase subunit RPC12/RpoP